MYIKNQPFKYKCNIRLTKKKCIKNFVLPTPLFFSTCQYFWDWPNICTFHKCFISLYYLQWKFSLRHFGFRDHNKIEKHWPTQRPKSFFSTLLQLLFDFERAIQKKRFLLPFNFLSLGYKISDLASLRGLNIFLK